MHCSLKFSSGRSLNKTSYLQKFLMFWHQPIITFFLVITLGKIGSTKNRKCLRCPKTILLTFVLNRKFFRVSTVISVQCMEKKHGYSQISYSCISRPEGMLIQIGIIFQSNFFCECINSVRRIISFLFEQQNSQHAWGLSRISA